MEFLKHPLKISHRLVCVNIVCVSVSSCKSLVYVLSLSVTSSLVHVLSVIRFLSFLHVLFLSVPFRLLMNGLCH